MVLRLATGLAIGCVGAALLWLTRRGPRWDPGSPRLRQANRVLGEFLIDWLSDGSRASRAQAEDDVLRFGRIALRLTGILYLVLAASILANTGG